MTTRDLDCTRWKRTSRATSVAERIARVRDADPSNDPTVIGAGPEACAACHNR